MKLKLNAFNEEMKDVVDTVNNICIKYTYQLDDCIAEVKELLANKDDLTIEQLNYYISVLPIYLYELTDKMQDLGMKSDAAKMQRKQVFSEIYDEQEHGTVAQKTAVAQLGSVDEQTIEDIFARVYKKCEQRIDMATMLHGSLKKILQWRVSELEVTRTNVFNTNNFM